MVRRVAMLVALAVAYFAAGKLGLGLAFVNPSASAVWPPTGIALALFLVLGYDVWPAVLVGAFFVNLTTAGTVVTSLGIGLGNTLEGLVGAYLVNRFARGRHMLDRAADLLRFAVLAVVAGPTVSATLGVTTLAAAGFTDWARFGPVWLTWWLGDGTGALLVTPALLEWANDPRPRWNAARTLEAAGLFVALALVALAVFDGLIPSRTQDYPLEFICIPLFIWAAFRFGGREAATAVLLVSAIATWGTLRGLGPFAGRSRNESLLLLQAFVGVAAVMTLVLAAVVRERREGEERLRHLSVSDPLTGLANYRHLAAVIEAEITRALRTGRPFAILFLDLDNLKLVNDRHGHLTGSRALVRVADVLRLSSRAMDTAARFGGDEFALVLPESAEVAARQVARRIGERLAADPEQPPVTVSIGVAEYPRDGKTAEALLATADRLLYQVKARGGGGLPGPA